MITRSVPVNAPLFAGLAAAVPASGAEAGDGGRPDTALEEQVAAGHAAACLVLGLGTREALVLAELAHKLVAVELELLTHLVISFPLLEARKQSRARVRSNDGR